MSTGRKAQQAMFLENLWTQMDRLASISSQQSISRVAAKYAGEGYDSNEIVELLVADGFDPHASRSCVAKLDTEEEIVVEAGNNEWGFEAEDQRRGDVVSNHDVRCASINAPSESLAWEKAQEFLDENCTDQYSVTRVFPV